MAQQRIPDDQPVTPTLRHGTPGVPTVQQGAPDPATARPGSTPTIQQGRSGTPTRQQGVGTPGTGAAGVSPVFPDELLDRFEPLEERGRGTEGVVWRCRRIGPDDEVAVKVQWAGRPIDRDLLGHLRNPAYRAHVPAIHDFGELVTAHGVVGWVAMEFFATTLAQFLDREAGGRPLDAKRAAEVIRGLATALNFWQSNVDRNPLDFKPDNLMVRPGRRPEFVIADFGGVAAFTASQQVGGTIMAAAAYTPPEEVWQEKRSPWPWWSLGEIVYLLATGHSRFQKPDGSMQPDQVIKRIRHVGELDLDEVADDRWRLLIRGLLTRDPYDRWTHAEVTDWLGGGSPAVAGPTLPMPAEPTYRPITFVDGRLFNDPADLAVALLDDWRGAERWLSGDGRQALLDWLTREKLDKRFDTTQLRGMGTNPTRLHRAVLAFGAAFAPDVVPRYRGDAVHAEGVVALLSAGGRGFALAKEFADDQILGVAAGYRCGHPGCVAARCAVLDRAATTYRTLVEDAEREVAEVGRSAAPEPWSVLSPGERDRISGFALLTLLDPGLAHAQLRPDGWTARAGPSWWRALRARALSADPTTPDGRLALVVAGVLTERAVAWQVDARKESRERATTVAGRIGRRIGTIVLLFVAMLLSSWSAAVLGVARSAFGSGQAGAALAADHAIGAQSALAPAMLVLSAEAVLLGTRRSSWLTGAVIVAAILSFLVDRIPAFTAIGLPSGVDTLLSTTAGLWRHSLAAGVALYAVLALICLAFAARLSSTGQAAPPRPGLLRTATPARRLAVFGLAVVTLPAALWTAGVLRYTLFDSTPRIFPTDVGRVMASYQSAYLVVLLAIAAVCALAWPRPATLAVGMAVAIAVGLWARYVPSLRVIWHPMAWPLFSGIANIWAVGAFWAALLLYVPILVACLRGAQRLARR